MPWITTYVDILFWLHFLIYTSHPLALPEESPVLCIWWSWNTQNEEKKICQMSIILKHQTESHPHKCSIHIVHDVWNFYNILNFWPGCPDLRCAQQYRFVNRFFTVWEGVGCKLGAWTLSFCACRWVTKAQGPLRNIFIWISNYNWSKNTFLFLCPMMNKVMTIPTDNHQNVFTYLSSRHLVTNH